MDYEILKLKVEEQIATLTISRPQALNALNSKFFSEMHSLLDEIKTRNDIRVMIITGEGKAFVAGADIAEMANMDSKQGTAFSKTGQQAFDKIGELPFPVIAAINGFALGGGCELAMACDFRIASSKAKLGQPEVNLGLIPGYAGTQRLSRFVGLGDALFLLMTAEMINAEEALRLGLVQKVTEPEKLMEECLKIANTIKKKGKNAIQKVKLVTRKGLGMDFHEGSSVEANFFGSLFDTEETKEGMKAFVEKREPKW
jgi:enoyl-CoA hydratase